MFRNSALATFLVTASFSLVLFSGCAEKNADGTTKKKQRILPPSSGTHSELLLVMPDELWEGAGHCVHVSVRSENPIGGVCPGQITAQSCAAYLQS